MDSQEERRFPKIDVIDDASAEILRAMSSQEKLKLAERMFIAGRQMIIDDLQAHHPDWNAQQIRDETFTRMCNDDVPDLNWRDYLLPKRD